ncbi:phenylacetic acid degradation protein [Mycolicibacterium duvalii]|uniref:Phenylacetic acid degradation protein n=1 Tax=Mycolicibacterium duvalii TaxID=39688 RepID=A0A7I7JZ64_9MYCO|nr:PaaI family thioesterase [Mycolicibacterium duvalii]MCV7370922.1 PaaI family thioesterase [Mycolicibacterium duvalii]PEG41272.1 phenylacetic acid degradation protein [Mycolicibacterium duvalii]BBX17177.1 phenylacetic acid degradation protein [Mycolicibacterium duvalii]
MTYVDRDSDRHDLETPDSIQVRFGIEYLLRDPAAATAVMSMPMERFRNPFTGAPTVGPLAVLVDAAAGIVNHYRRGPGQWTVSSELSMELSMDGLDDLDGPVTATAHAVGPRGVASLGTCTLTYRGAMIGSGTVRSFFINADDVVSQRRPETLRRTAETTFADLMAARIRPDSGAYVLSQNADENLNNDIHIVHGGVAAAGLETTSSAAVNRGNSDDLLQTASLRVNFLRPFFAGTDSRYEGKALRIGRSTAVGDAHAIGDDGKVAVIARITAYR